MVSEREAILAFFRDRLEALVSPDDLKDLSTLIARYAFAADQRGFTCYRLRCRRLPKVAPTNAVDSGEHSRCR